MKNTIAITLLLFFSCIAIRSYAQRFDGAAGWGNTKSDKATTVKTDDSGYIYVCGYFSKTITLGTNAVVVNYVGSQTSKEVFVAKFDSTFKCLWAKAAGNGFDDRALGMDVDSAGNVTVTGTYWSSGINFDGNSLNGSGSGDECFVVHFNTNGVYQWGHTISSDGGDDQGLDIATDKWGNHYVVGFMEGENLVMTGSVVTAANANNAFNTSSWGGYNQYNSFWLTKLDSNGVGKWMRTFARQPFDSNYGKYIERDIAVCVDDSGGVYVGGGYEKITTFNGVNDTAKGGTDVFILKYDSAGNFQWVTKGGSYKDDWINGITYDEQGHIYIAGEHRDSLIIDTLLIKNYNRRDAFVAKFNAKTGKPIWGKRAGSNLGGERANDVYADANCNVYVTGDIQQGAKFSDNLYAPLGNSLQAFVARMTPEGKFLWVATGGGTDSNDRGNSIIKGNGAQVYACGFHRLPATFGSTTLPTAGSSDAYVVRLHDSLYNKSSDFKFSRPLDSVVCKGDTAFIEIPEHKAISIVPATGVTYNADTSKLFFTPTQSTTYTITGYAGTTCISYDTMVFSILFAPSPTLTMDSIVCPGGSTYLALASLSAITLNPANNLTYNADTSVVTFVPNATTTYTLSGYSDNLCASYEPIVFKVYVAPLPYPNISVSPANAIMIDTITVTFSNTSALATSFLWSDSFGTIGTASSISKTYNPDSNAYGTYCFFLQTTSNEGCIAIDTACVTLSYPSTSTSANLIVMPDAFTPNGDAINELYRPITMYTDINTIRNYEMRIYDRLGNELFITKDPFKGWNGKYKNDEEGAQQTYMYMVRYIDRKGVAQIQAGTFDLLR
jgi:gliding motility-associated-like protein